jgi:hypothetical protein
MISLRINRNNRSDMLNHRTKCGDVTLRVEKNVGTTTLSNLVRQPVTALLAEFTRFIKRKRN